MSTTAQGHAVANHGVVEPSTHKRPWEELPPEQERPGHISRAQMHFDKHIIDRNEPRANHPGWVERTPKKRRSTKSNHQAARDHQSMSHARHHHENSYHSSRPMSYGGPPPVPNIHDPSKPGPSLHTPEGRTYTPLGWRQHGGEFDKYAKNQEPLTLDVDETLPPPVGWTERPRDYNLLPIGRSSSSRGDSQSSQSPQAPQRPSHHPNQHPQPYLLPIDERPPPPQQHPPPQHYQQPPPRRESTAAPPPSTYQPSQQQINYQPPRQRPIESSEPPRQQQDWSEYRREDSRERPSPSMPVNVGRGEHPPPPASQSSYDQRSVERAQEPARYQSHLQQQQQPERHEYHQQPLTQQQEQQSEYRHKPRPASPARFGDQLHEQQAQQPHQAPPSARQYHTQPPPTQSHARIAITAAGCKNCADSGKIIRAFEEQAKEIYSLFGLWGGYTEIHEEYIGKGYGHDDVPGFKEFHRITALVAEASALAGYMVKLAPLLTKRIKHEKDGDIDRVHAVDSEVFRLRKEMDEKLREMRIDGGEESATPSPYTSEPRPQIALFVGEQRHVSMAPPPIPQQQPSPIPSQNERQLPSQLPHHPQSPAPSASSQIEPASTRRSATFNATLAQNNPNVPTFAIESSDPTLEAKLTKLRARLETEISEVDNLTEEKKRLEERIKELEAVAEEERERRREGIDVGIKDRISFLSVLEGIVALGRREGDPTIKRENAPSVAGDGGEDPKINNNHNNNDAGERETDINKLRKEMEKLRERNRVCESALEHIARETRHMEETGRKGEESRRGIDLVLGRVLAGREGPTGNVSLATEAAPAVRPTASEVGASVPVLAIEAAPVVQAMAAVPIVPGAAIPVAEKERSKEVVEVKECA